MCRKDKKKIKAKNQIQIMKGYTKTFSIIYKKI
jgi:hypothetical protein